MKILKINILLFAFFISIIGNLQAVRQPVNHHPQENSQISHLPLHKAILLADSMYAKQCNENIRDLVNNGVDLNEQDADGKTPLHIAVMHNNFDIVKQLLDAGANIKIEDKQGQTALSYVSGDADIFQLFALQMAYHNGLYN